MALDEEQLYLACLRFIEANTEAVLLTPAFEKLCLAALCAGAPLPLPRATCRRRSPRRAADGRPGRSAGLVGALGGLGVSGVFLSHSTHRA
jgi:hypothetical protein